MRHRHPLPRLWLMTDERIVDLDAAIAKLPRRSGIIFRHYGLPAPNRKALFLHVKRLAKRLRHVLLLADTPDVAQSWGADGAHHRSARASRGLRSVAVHNVVERVTARRVHADLIFVSPAFPTQSHIGARTLGVVRLGLLAGGDRRRTIALGGMSGRRARTLSALNLYGWAAIDAFRI